MKTVDTTHWPQTWIQRWQLIAQHRFDDPDAPLPFSVRLAREHGWSHAEALQAIEEYRRFCFLASTSGRGGEGADPAFEVTPSDTVDEVWHQHLTYTHDYWQRWCRDALGQELHHAPTRGRRADAQRYAAQYADTLAAYERCFGAPPERWWPGTRERFHAAARWQRIDRARVFVVPRPSVRTYAAAFVALAAALLVVPRAFAALPANPLDWTAGPFLALYAIAIVVALIAGAVLRRSLRETGDTGSGAGLDTWEIAYLSGGRMRALDATITELMTRNVLRVDAVSRKLVREGDAHGLKYPLGRVAELAARHGSAEEVARAGGPALFDPLRQDLLRRGLLLSPAQAARAALLASLPLLAVIAFGVGKILVGISRAKPVGFLVVLTIVLGIVALVLAFKRPERSRAGDRVYATLRAQHARAARAPRAEEAALAVALVGTAVLSGTAYAAFHTLRQPVGSNTTGDGGSSGSGCSNSGSDGGGGGGCGGCGGGGGGD